MTARAFLVAVMVGCGAPARPVPLHNATPASAAELVGRADRAFAASLAPDYDEPFAPRAPDREPVRALYLEACRAGVHRACWIASAIHPHEADADPAAEAQVVANCRAGDLASCRAIRLPVEPTDDLPGHAGRSCWGTPLAKRYGLRDCETCNKPCTADVQALHQECAAGFPLSCRLASDLDLGHRDADEDDARVGAIERADCALGMTRECDLASSRAASQRTALARLCQLAIDRCRDLGASAYDPDLARSTDDVTVARDAYERLCQFSPLAERDASCAALLELYDSGTAPDAVPGRRAALRRWHAAAR